MEQGKNQTNQRGLSRTRFSQYRRTRTRTEIETEMMDDVAHLLALAIREFILIVGIGNIIETNAARRRHLERFTLLFQRILFQLHQSLGCSKHAHEGRGQFGKITCRRLYLVYQLQKGGHATKGKSACSHAQGCPEEGYKIAQGKAEVQEEITQHIELGTHHHIAPQPALGFLQFLHHRLLRLQGLHEHAMLDGFLQDALHLTVGIAYQAGEISHLVHIDFAERQEDRNHDDDDDGQHLIHGEEIEEGTEEHRQHTQGVRQCLRKEINHLVHIVLQAVEHIARMHLLPAVPLGTQDAIEHALLHAVLRPDAQHVANPDASYAQGEVAENQQSHQAHRPIDIALHGMGGNIDGTLHRPYLRQAHAHRK